MKPQRLLTRPLFAPSRPIEVTGFKKIRHRFFLDPREGLVGYAILQTSAHDFPGAVTDFPRLAGGVRAESEASDDLCRSVPKMKKEAFGDSVFLQAAGLEPAGLMFDVVRRRGARYDVSACVHDEVVP